MFESHSGLNKYSCSIPQLREDVGRLLTSCLEEISTLPKPLETDPQIEVLVRVSAFCDAFRGVVSGASSDKGLAQRNRALYTILAQNIRETYPDFRPFEEPTHYSPIYDLESEEPPVVRNDRVEPKEVALEEADRGSISKSVPFPSFAGYPF